MAKSSVWSKLSATARTALQREMKRPGTSFAWGQLVTVQPGKGPWGTIIVIGLGKRNEWSLRRFRLATRRMIRQSLSQRWSTVTMEFGMLTPDDVARVVESSVMAAYDYRTHKQEPKHGWPQVKQVTIVANDIKPEHRLAAKRGEIIARHVNHARDLANTPGGLMTPTVLASAAVKIGKQHTLKVSVLTPTQMKKLNMGALLGVGKGSDEEPRLIVMEYFGTERSTKPLVIVGKGITFDSGGYNLKPGNSMSEMHMDMAGGASALCAVAAMSELQMPINAVAIVPAAENMVSGSGFRPGDILQSMSGLNIEIGNTDAEGRLVLADGLTYAQKMYTPAVVVDVATLTGAALVALGQEATALLTKSPNLQTAGIDIGEASGDYVWPLPMWEEYDGLVKATFGDVTNSGTSRWGGTIEGAIFLSKFVKDVPHVHLDIAPTMSSIDGQHLAPGATGVGVRWLVTLAQRVAAGEMIV